MGNGVAAPAGHSGTRGGWHREEAHGWEVPELGDDAALGQSWFCLPE